MQIAQRINPFFIKKNGSTKLPLAVVRTNVNAGALLALCSCQSRRYHAPRSMPAASHVIVTGTRASGTRMAGMLSPVFVWGLWGGMIMSRAHPSMHACCMTMCLCAARRAGRSSTNDAHPVPPPQEPKSLEWFTHLHAAVANAAGPQSGVLPSHQASH